MKNVKCKVSCSIKIVNTVQSLQPKPLISKQFGLNYGSTVLSLTSDLYSLTSLDNTESRLIGDQIIEVLQQFLVLLQQSPLPILSFVGSEVGDIRAHYLLSNIKRTMRMAKILKLLQYNLIFILGRILFPHTQLHYSTNNYRIQPILAH